MSFRRASHGSRLSFTASRDRLRRFLTPPGAADEESEEDAGRNPSSSPETDDKRGRGREPSPLSLVDRKSSTKANDDRNAPLRTQRREREEEDLVSLAQMSPIPQPPPRPSPVGEVETGVSSLVNFNYRIKRLPSKISRTSSSMWEFNTRSTNSSDSTRHENADTLFCAANGFCRVTLVNVSISVVLSALVIYVFPISWQHRLEKCSPLVAVSGVLLCSAIALRTHVCRERWREAREQWLRMTSGCINLSGQARAYFGDAALAEKFSAQCVVLPYVCKSFFEGGKETSLKEGPRLLERGVLTDAELGTIVRHGGSPFTCLEIMRQVIREAFLGGDGIHAQSCSHGAFLAMEQVISEIHRTVTACLKIKTEIACHHTAFLRSLAIFFFASATLLWSPTAKWLTPIITGAMVFLANAAIVVGDQMMRPFDLRKDGCGGLPLEYFCGTTEREILNASRRHSDINTLFNI